MWHPKRWAFGPNNIFHSISFQRWPSSRGYAAIVEQKEKGIDKSSTVTYLSLLILKTAEKKETSNMSLSKKRYYPLLGLENEIFPDSYGAKIII